MKTGVGLAALLLGVFAAFPLQEAIPAVHALHGARLIFVPLIFCYGSMVLPFPAMLVAAFYTGFLSDLMYLNVVGGRVEIALGWSIVLFVIFGSIGQGLQPAMKRGVWWPLVPLSALVTSGYLALQFAMISLRRDDFIFDENGVWRILAPGFLAALFSPLLHMGTGWLAQFLPSEPGRSRAY